MALGEVAEAQDGPGLGNLSYTAGQVPAAGASISSGVVADIKILKSTGQSNETRNQSHVFMHRGYLYVITGRDSGNDGGGIEVYNFTDPKNPVQRYKRSDAVTRPMREVHAYGMWRNDADGKEYVALQARNGIQIWNITNPLLPALAKDMTIADVGDDSADYGDGIWWISAQPPFLYLAGSENGVYILCVGPASGVSACSAASPTNPVVIKRIPREDIGNFRSNIAQAVGNIMMMGLTDTSPGGLSFYDISDPINPEHKVTQAENVAAKTYTYLLAGPQNDASKLYVYGASRAGDANGFRVMELNQTTSPWSIVERKNVAATSNGTNYGNIKIGYGNFQIDCGPNGTGACKSFVHLGYSERVFKIDVTDNLNPVKVMQGMSSNGEADEDFVTVLGNVVFSGNDHDSSSQYGSAIYPHQMHPDKTPPQVTYVNPVPGATGLTSKIRIGAIFSDNIDMRSVNTSTVTVRPLGGSAIAGTYAPAFHYLNFTPNAPLASGSYEIVVNGVKDWAGNTMTTPFTSTFTVGTVSAPANCVVNVDGSTNPPVKQIGAGGTSDEDVAVTVTGCTASGPLDYVYQWGDGTVTGPTPSASVSHNYGSNPGHYTITVEARIPDGASYLTRSFTRRLTVTYPPTAAKPTRSSPVFYDDRGTATDFTDDRLHVVNPDRNSVRSFKVSDIDNPANPDAPSLTNAWEAPVARNPRTLAVRPGTAQLWVVNQDDASIFVLNALTGAYAAVIHLPNGSRPFGLAFNPAGTAAFVTLEGAGKLIKIDPALANPDNPASMAPGNHGFPLVNPIVAEVSFPAGAKPRGLAVHGDGNRVMVTRFITNAADGSIRDANNASILGGDVYEVSAGTMALVRTTKIAADPNVNDTESSGRGMPNYLQAVTISPDGRRAVVPSKKDNIFRGVFRDGRTLNFENTVRTAVSIVDLVNNYQMDMGPAYPTVAAPDNDYNYRRDINNADMGNSAVYTRNGDWIFVAHHNNQVSLYDGLNYRSTTIVGLDVTGLTPQGLAIKPDDSRLYVWNFMSRNVEVYDVSSVGNGNTFTRKATASFQTSEALAPNVLRGKKVFYNSADDRMSRDDYMACASCHLEGGADETVFDFTDIGEGLRNTIALLGRRGMGHGRVHWTANFDEIQDFEHPVRTLFGGTGLLSNADFNSGTRNQPLGDLKSTAPSAATTNPPGLNDMSDYVSSLATVPRSPFRNVDGTLNTSVPVMGGTGNGVTGKSLFASKNCVSCHSGRDFTDSNSGVLHDVGTQTAASGKRLGATLTGLDTPTLLGVWNTAPYLHDGSAPDLETVLANPTHVGALTAQEKRDLVAYLKQIDDMGRDFTISSFVVNDGASPEWSLRGDLAVGDIAYGDRAYTWSSIPAIAQDATWIRTAADSKTFGPGTVASFVVDRNVDIYVALDDRCTDEAGEKPTWMDGTWTDSGADMQARETNGTIRTMSLWKKSMPAGTINLQGQIDGNTGLANVDAQNYTVIIKATPPGSVPLAPTGLVAVAGDRSATLSWVASAGALTYQVLRSTTSGSGHVQIASNVSATSYSDTNLTNGITYYYVVKAVNGTGASPSSSQASATPTCSVLAAPTGLSLMPGTNQVTLSWNAVPGAAGYNIKRSTVSGSGPPTVANSVTNVFTNTGLTAGQNYYFRVSATNSCGESADSAEAGPAAPTAAGAMNAAFIVKDNDTVAPGVQLTAGDAPIRQMLVDLGFNVTNIVDSVSSSTDANGQQLVFISCSVGSGNVNTKFDSVAVPVMLNERALLIDMRVSASETAPSADQTGLHIERPDSPLAGGLSGDPVVTIAPVTFNANVPLASAENVATLLGNPSLSAIFAYAPGAALTSGTAPAKRLVFFLDDNGAVANQTAPQLNSDGRNLFTSAVMWAVGSGASVPMPPTNLAVTSSSGQANLTWTGSAGATSYKVKSANQSGGPFMVVATVSGTSYQDIGVADGVTYYYVVTAVNGAGESGASNEVNTTPGCTMPPAPTGVTASWSGTQANLAWNVVGVANSYKVKRSTDGTNFSTIASGITTNAYVNTGLAAGTSYYFTVSSVNACGESAPSAMACASSTGCVYGGAAPQVGLSGAAVTVQAENYDVNGYNDVDGTNSGAASTSYRSDGWDLDNASCGAGCWNVGFFATNDWVQHTIDVRATGTYTLKLRAATSTTTGNKKAKVYVDGVAINGGADITLANTANFNTYAETTVSNVALTAGLRVIRVLVSAGSWNFDAMSFTLAAPAAPTGLTGTPSSGQVSLSWAATANATSYQVKRSTTSGSGYVTVASPTSNSHVDTGLVNGTAYYYVVAAVNNAGAGANSAQVAATPAGAASAPTGVTATPGGNQIVISWAAVPGATSYKVLRSTTSGSGYTQVATPTTTSWPHTSVANGTYYYVVQTVNGSGTSGNSAEVTASLAQPDRDTYVRSGASAALNYGVAPTIDVKMDTATDTKRNGFMRFSLAGADVVVSSAKLRIYGSTPTATKTMAVCGVSDIGWPEGTGNGAAGSINWNYPTSNAGGPAMSTTCTNVTVPMTAAYIEVDVTAWVAARKAAGDTHVTLGLKWTANSGNGQSVFNSRENASNKPQLWIGSKP